MKAKYALMVTCAFAWALSASGAITCSSFDGELRLEDWSYEGGPAPYPGMKVGETTWTYKGAVVAHQIQKEGDPIAPLGIDVKTEKYTLLDSQQGNAWASSYYSELVTLTRPNGDVIAKDFLLCRNLQQFLP